MTPSGTARSGGCCAFRISPHSGNLTARGAEGGYGARMPSALDHHRRRERARDTRLAAFLLAAYVSVVVLVFAS